METVHAHEEYFARPAQDFSSFFCSEEEVTQRLEQIMVGACGRVWDSAQAKTLPLRAAAYIVACERVLNARRIRGLYPQEPPRSAGVRTRSACAFGKAACADGLRRVRRVSAPRRPRACAQGESCMSDMTTS